MTTEIRYRRGTTAEHATFTGAAAEITVNTDNNSLIVHDGATVGGFETASIVGLATKADQSALDATDAAVTANTAAVLANATALGLKANVTALYTKINEPGTEGTAGQFLMTDGVGGRTWVTPDTGVSQGALDLKADQTDLETLEAVVIEGLGAFATDIATNTAAIATNTAAIAEFSGVPVNHEDNLAADADFGGLITPTPAFAGEVDPTLSINCSIGYQTFDLGLAA